MQQATNYNWLQTIVQVGAAVVVADCKFSIHETFIYTLLGLGQKKPGEKPSGQNPPDKSTPDKSPLTKSPPIMMKSKLMFFCYAFFYIDSDIRYIKV